MSKNKNGGWIGLGFFLLALAAFAAYQQRKKEEGESNSERHR